MKYLQFILLSLWLLVFHVYGHAQDENYIVQANNSHISEPNLVHASEIISQRLITAGMDPISIKVIGGRGQIEIHIKQELSVEIASLLLTQKGNLAFQETVDYFHFLETVPKSDPIYDHFEITPTSEAESRSANAVLGVIEESKVDEIKMHLDRLQQRGHLEDMNVRLGLQQDSYGKKKLYTLTTQSGSSIGRSQITSVALDKSDLADFNLMLTLSPEASEIWSNITRRNVGKMVAITLDGEVLVSPRVMEEITGGKLQISGNWSVDEWKVMHAIFESDELPSSFSIVE